MRFIVAFILPLAAASAFAQPASAPLTYPETQRGDVVEEQFGERVADPYRWLENDVRQDPAVRAWVTAQNEVSRRFLAALPARAAIPRADDRDVQLRAVRPAGKSRQPLFLHPQ